MNCPSDTTIIIVTRVVLLVGDYVSQINVLAPAAILFFWNYTVISDSDIENTTFECEGKIFENQKRFAASAVLQFSQKGMYLTYSV